MDKFNPLFGDRPQGKIPDKIEIEIIDSKLADIKARESFEKAISPLPSKQQVIQYRSNIGESRTLDEVAAKLGVTRERVRKVEQDALAHLRQDPNFKDYEGSLA